MSWVKTSVVGEAPSPRESGSLDAFEVEQLMELGRVEFAGGEYQRALGFFESARERYRAIGNLDGEAKAIGLIGTMRHMMGEHDAAIAYYQHALAIHRLEGARRSEGGILGDLGLTAINRGRYEQAVEYFEQALAILTEIGDEFGACFNYGNLGLARSRMGRGQEAIPLFERAIRLARTVGDPRSEGVFLGNLGDCYVEMERWEEAEACLRAAIEICDASIPPAAGSFRGSLALLLCRREAYVEAMELIRIGEEQIGSIPEEFAKFLCKKGRVQYRSGSLDDARLSLDRAQRLARESKLDESGDVGLSVAGLADLLAEEG